jgi:hypothetical protein
MEGSRIRGAPPGVLFAKPAVLKQSNDAIVRAFRERVKSVAGFAFVPEPLPMKNSNSAIVY